MFRYDEKGRLTKIERDYGNGNLQTAYEYGYNSDGVRVWKRDYLNQQEYRYLCRIGCGGVPMRVYNRAIGGTSWNTLEEYVDTPTAVWYGAGAESFNDYPMVAGHWLSNLLPPAAGQMLYLDAFGLRTGGEFGTAAVPKRVAEYIEMNPELPTEFVVAPLSIPAICAVPCAVGGLCAAAGLTYIIGCMVGCAGTPDFWRCAVGWISSIPGWIIAACGVILAACILCILWPFIGRGLGRIDEGLDKLCLGYKTIIPKCLREV